VAADTQTKPNRLDCESTCWLLLSTPTTAILLKAYYFQSRAGTDHTQNPPSPDRGGHGENGPIAVKGTYW